MATIIEDRQAQPAGGADGSRSGGGPRPAALDVVAGPGGVPSNTPPANSMGCGPGGEDTLHLAIGVRWLDPEACFAELDRLKQEAVQTGRDVAFERIGFTAYMQPHGVRGKDGSPSMTWVFEMGAGTWFGVQRVAAPQGENANVYVRIGSYDLIAQGGAWWAWRTVLGVVRELGGVVEWDKPSRVDLCVDLRGDLITPLAKAIWENKHICRARKQAFYRDGHELVTGVDVGRGGEIMMRGYRKDIEAAEKELLLVEIAEKRFGIPEEALDEGVSIGIFSRIEFQLRREALKEFNVDSMADYLSRRAQIAEYLVGKWFRLAEAEVDRTNTSREGLSELWQQIAEAFRDAFGRGVGAASRVVRRCYDAKANAAQAIGNAIAYLVAAGGGNVADERDLVGKLCFMMDEHVMRRPAAWLEKCWAKEKRAADRMPGIRGAPCT